MSKRFIILGSGESGTGAAILAKKQGWYVFVSDAGEIPGKYKEELERYGIEWEEGKHSEERILHADEVMKSPVFQIRRQW
jgi:UDP-N-acetylmuramoylalanine--D-glutamate ligase